MALALNFPFISIMLCLASGIISSVLRSRAARILTLCSVAAVFALNTVTLLFTLGSEASWPFMMGHFPAPFGNELRIGRLEALLAAVFSLLLLVTLLAGLFRLDENMGQSKQNLYLIMVDLMLASLLVMLYSNDLFTCYVFIEIGTIAACALIMVRQNGHTLVAATRYLVMNLLGSGLLLIAITLTYGITGHLLMEHIQPAMHHLFATGAYGLPLTVIIALFTVSIAIKSALFPFHGWAPDAYAYAPALSGAMLSGFVSKGYIFLLIKIFYRMIGIDIIKAQRVDDVLFIFGVAGMILGSVAAIRQSEIRRMIAYSSVAQIGYVYMGLGLGSASGTAAALFQLLSHAAGKSLLFLSMPGLVAVSGDRKRFRYLHGAGFRDRLSGLAFTVGAMSMVGIPLTGGFVSKLYFAVAGLSASRAQSVTVVIALALSTLLNAVYFLHTVVNLYRHPLGGLQYPPHRPSPIYAGVALLGSTVLTVALGVFSAPVMRVIEQGLSLFL